MLDKIEKIERFTNNLLIKIFGFLGKLFSKIIHFIVPQAVFTFLGQTKTNFKNKLSQAIAWVVELAKKSFFFLLSSKDHLFTSIDKIQNYPIKQKALGAIIIVKDAVVKTSPKDYFKIIKKRLHAIWTFIDKKTKRFQPQQTKLFFGTLSLAALGSFSIYMGVKHIYKSEFPSRAPANVQEYDYRPEYHLYEQKIIKVQNVKVPISVEETGKMNSITIDFGMRLSTRFARYFISEYEYRLKDYFFTAVEPIVSDFPIEEEGKELLKEKIQLEINNFLEDNGVEGHVEEVYILYIVGS